MRETATHKAGRGFNRNIHGARGLFSSLVFVFHVAYSQLPPPPIPHHDLFQIAANSLAFGVELFFIISGIVILGAFRRAPDAATFLIDRATRIFPVLWATVFVMFVLNLVGTDRFGEHSALGTVGILAANFFAMPPIVPVPLIHGAAWSLSYEFAFYLLFVLFGLLAVRLDRRIALALTVAAALAVFWVHVRATFFIGGLIIGAGWMHRPALVPLLRIPLLWIIVFLASWQSVALLVGGNIHAAIYARLATDPLLVGLALVAFASALLAMAGIEQGYGHLSAWLRRPTFQWLGTISFSFYLWQTPVMAVVKHVMYATGLVDLAGSMAQPLFFLLALLPTLAVSHLSQRFIEVGATNWLRAHRPSGEPKHLRPESPA